MTDDDAKYLKIKGNYGCTNGEVAFIGFADLGD